MPLASLHGIGRRKHEVSEPKAERNYENTNVENTPLSLRPQSLIDKNVHRKARCSTREATRRLRRHLRLQNFILEMKHDQAGQRSCRRCIVGVGEENEIEGDDPGLSHHKHGKAQTKDVTNVCCVRHVTASRSRSSKRAETRPWEEPEIDGDSFTVQLEADGITTAENRTTTENRSIDQFSLPPPLHRRRHNHVESTGDSQEIAL